MNIPNYIYINYQDQSRSHNLILDYLEMGTAKGFLISAEHLVMDVDAFSMHQSNTYYRSK